jgi:2-keto-3-deoxy-L-rhamnonate aldolase RhmA
MTDPLSPGAGAPEAPGGADAPPAPLALRARLRQGGVALGTMVFEFSSPGLPAVLATTGVDFVVYDMEHSGFGIETIKGLMAGNRGSEVVPLVRVPAAEYHFIARVLDAGAHGVMVPMVESRAQAERIVQAARYPPVGRRGAAFGVAHDDYREGDVAEKIRQRNERTLVIAQIETEAGLMQAEEIIGVPGLDVAWVGHFDLTLSMGIPAQFDHPRFLAAMEEIVAVCRRHGVTPGVMATDVATAARWLDQGFRALAYSGDIWLLAAALRQGVSQLEHHRRPPTP